MRQRCLSLVLLWALLGLAPAAAHEVHHSIAAGAAVVVQLNYADGKPFAFEAFEATPEGAEIPAQVGRTDAEGRAVFIPGKEQHWKLKAYSADGHGVNLAFTAPAVAAVSAATNESPTRASLLLFGLSLLLGGFGAYQLWLKKKP